jgi:hypothetical protein
MGLNLVLNSRELDPLSGCKGASSPLPVEAGCLLEVRLRVVSVTERLDASVDARPSIRSTSSGTCVHESVNVSDSLQNGSSRENESGLVRKVEDVCDCEELTHEDVPPRKTLRSRGMWCANASESVDGYLENPNESKRVCLNADESAISKTGNEKMSD